MWILFLISIFLTGFLATKAFLKNFSSTIKIPSCFILGSLLSVSFIYYLNSFLIKNLSLAIGIYFLICLILFLFFSSFSLKKSGLIFFLVFLAFSWYLCRKTFNYEPHQAQFLIASHSYSDFGVRIPFIRSFSKGANFPFEVPFFAGAKLRYHFMFDLYAGILEFLGSRIDLALNLISSIAFACLLLMIYALGQKIFHNPLVGVISLILFLFPSDLSFINFFRQYGLKPATLFYFWNNAQYRVDSFLGNNTVSTFINLNNLLNQRQLIFGLLFALFIIYLIYDRQFFLPAILLGLFFFWHSTILMAIFIWLTTFALINRPYRKNIFFLLAITGLIIFPQFLATYPSLNKIFSFKPGFLISNRLSLKNFLSFWTLNLGLTIPAALTGFLLADKRQKKFFLVSLTLFIIPNLFRLSQEMFDNHKFFDFWIILANYFSAFLIASLLKKGFFVKIGALMLLFFLTFSGLLNFLVIKNDVYTRIIDFPHNSLMFWVDQNISKNEILLTNGELYDPISLIGQKTFLGARQQIFTYGAKDIDERINLQNKALGEKSFWEIKEKLTYYKIKYLVIYQKDFAKNTLKTDYQFFQKNFKINYEDDDGLVIKI